MICKHFAEGQVLFREGDPADCVFRLLSGAVDILRELDGDPEGQSAHSTRQSDETPELSPGNNHGPEKFRRVPWASTKEKASLGRGQVSLGIPTCNPCSLADERVLIRAGCPKKKPPGGETERPSRCALRMDLNSSRELPRLSYRSASRPPQNLAGGLWRVDTERPQVALRRGLSIPRSSGIPREKRQPVIAAGRNLTDPAVARLKDLEEIYPLLQDEGTG